ncbi:MAG TPA: hypothetical protein VH207_12705 [Chthoniobacterales bacterium]|jgi:dihydropyrimidine dehydrogenase (NAD+) subunit PreA|nr:hypothetical protein [Chthoniobacterales bacterium]
MRNLSTNLAGIESTNPFWIASGPTANTAYQAHRAFEAGWGGVVWKTIGDPIRNVSSRYSSIDYGNMRMAGFNNIELISDRAPETNFREIAEVKSAGLTMPSSPPSWSTRARTGTTSSRARPIVGPTGSN